MPFEVSWLVEGQIIHANLKGKITVEEIQENSELAISMFESTDAALVHVLTNEADLDSLPMSLKLVSEATGFLQHPKTGWMIMYGSDDRIPRFMTAMITGMTKVRHRRFDTLEESLEFLMSVDSTLPPLEEMMR